MNGGLRLGLLCLGRGAGSLIYMTYTACMAVLIPTWRMSAAEAGTIQAAFSIGFALSLLFTSWLADRAGAKRVLLISTWLSAASALAFGLLARSYSTGLVLGALVGLAQGGTYTPAIMVIAERIPSTRRGHALGWLLASSSLGYVVSLLTAWAGLRYAGYQLAFTVSALGPTAGVLITWLAVRESPNLVHVRGQARFAWGRVLRERRSLLLTIGYTAHSWEVLGMWAWAPTFLVAALGSGTTRGGIGLWVAALLHLSGSTASLTMGRASDRLGRRRILVGVGAAGALCSLSFGWMLGMPLAVILPLAALYGFLAAGDSPVLSTAISEAVPPGYLGSALALRSILGFGAGALAPIVFGGVLDLAGGPLRGGWGWGMAFGLLGLGGIVATLSALLLPSSAERASSR
jgi:MFS family permease